ncbi:MAG: hypothetical protein ACREAY_08595 [Nitrososphaera sp.]
MAQVVSTLPVNASRLSFAVHASLLGSFIALVGFIAVICHHVH